MAKRIGLTMRVADAVGYVEPRDCLAHDWGVFLAQALPEVAWLPIPNLGEAVLAFVAHWQLDGLILTGGNDLGACPLRDLTEARLLDWALAQRHPVLGVCRGLQMIQTWLGGSLQACDRDRHVGRSHPVVVERLGLPLPPGPRVVNSYHGQAVLASSVAPFLHALAVSEDGLAEALGHTEAPILAVQWHPERNPAPDPQDVALLRNWFGGSFETTRREE